MSDPQQLGKYKVVKRLGQGATSTVYLGYDAFAGREVAIKVLKPEILNDPKTGGIHKKQLLTEASLAGKLSHPHIIAIYDAVMGDDASYIVMEYVGGGTLEQHATPANLLPISRVVEYMFKCCRALNYAQFHGVIHRDIKPANILLTHDGDIKISDMGAAIVLTNADQTQISDIGSPVYMSPEQIRGETLTHQTDIYSLGCVMYCLLTGQLPYSAKSVAALFHQVLNTELTPPRQYRPDIPEHLERIVMRAMHKDKAGRYQDWKEFGNDLAAALERLGPEEQQGNEAEKFTVLRKMALFGDFSDTELWEILHICEWEQRPAHSVLMQEDELGNTFYILTDGSAMVGRGKRLLSVIQAGDCFGEMAYISGKPVPRSATVTAITDVTMIKIPPNLLPQLSDQTQLHFTQAFLRVLADRLRVTDDRFAKLVS